ncbi:MAG: peptidase S41, partial [Xanthomonadaceae bacterium]|nr:peptidase S41 [Xanthomonadaceae bacterium]
MLRCALCTILLLAPLVLHADEAKPASPSNPGVSMADIRQFTAVFDLIKQAYVDPVDDKTLMQSAIRGML